MITLSEGRVEKHAVSTPGTTHHQQVYVWGIWQGDHSFVKDIFLQQRSTSYWFLLSITGGKEETPGLWGWVLRNMSALGYLITRWSGFRLSSVFHFIEAFFRHLLHFLRLLFFLFIEDNDLVWIRVETVHCAEQKHIALLNHSVSSETIPAWLFSRKCLTASKLSPR